MTAFANSDDVDRLDARLELTEFQLDALAETLNLSLGEAAAVFSQLVAEEIELTVPTVELITRDELVRRMEALQTPGASELLCGISQSFEAESLFSTDTMLVFPERGSLEIVRRMLGNAVPIERITELEQDALAEIGNIIINGCMSSLSNLFQTSLNGTLPKVRLSDACTMFDSLDTADKILVARIGLRMSVQNVSGYVLFMMDLDSMRNFIKQSRNLFAV